MLILNRMISVTTPNNLNGHRPVRNGLLTIGLSVVALVLTFMASGCGYDGSYRYPCQDPANWEAEECQPPLCEADGTCTKFLLPEEALSE